MLDAAGPSPLTAALAARSALLDEDHVGAFRLFNGHLEGDPRFVLDAYARTLLIYQHVGRSAEVARDLATALERVSNAFPWLDTVVVKEREADTDDDRRGRIVHQRPGSAGPARTIEEHGVYATPST